MPVASGNALAKRMALEGERPSVPAKAHGERERIAGRGEMVADDAVEGGKRDFPPARHRTIVRLCGDEPGGGADARAGQPEGLADAAIDEFCDAAGERPTKRGKARRVEDVVMHMLDDAGQAFRRVRSETAEAEDVR